MSESKHTRNERFLDALVEELQTMPESDALEGENAESLVKLGNEIVQDARYTARRIGPTEPDDTMVICPVCTSQFRAIPLDAQRLRRQRDELLEALGDLHDAIMEIATKMDAVIARAEGRRDE